MLTVDDILGSLTVTEELLASEKNVTLMLVTLQTPNGLSVQSIVDVRVDERSVWSAPIGRLQDSIDVFNNNVIAI